ncbi:sigma-70 family RNA polymerase sigma factor [Thermoanaerobacterium sp. RBIITD]|uniref:RNA polymerase sigma factor n=1 Tax=Thermoanaerobacterium sp. RBIITD TaxID=1550240 RepID=UPI000BB9B964|nr:sigma-70 family RNA polymerase sigma factor [Thermoanaerobacterium sp. RBIITD]SNX55123.1 RNA polymerase sigma-70 factor, ECF subfamily [Thermoanaerobacterium sp. RBIITD]
MNANELLNLAKNGDINAFETVISNYQNYIYNIIFRIVGLKEDALDLTQETLIKAYINLNKFKGNSEFKTWLYKIAVNVSLDFIRKKKGVEEQLNEISDLRTPEDIVDERITREIILDELNKLQNDYKIALILRDIEGLSYSEISKITKASLGTVKSRISRARNILKENLKHVPEFLNYIEERRPI